MRKLKLLSLNLHCLEEDNLQEKQSRIVDEIIKRDIDVVFLQEVAQYLDSDIVYGNLKDSNYAYQLQQQLLKKGAQYHLYFEPIKKAFNKYDEGVALLSKYSLHNIKGNHISKCTEYHYWRTRKMIKGDLVRLDKTISFVSVHLGWSDNYESFEDQIERLTAHLDDNNVLIIAGDFNVSPKTNEYGYIIDKGLNDLYGSNPKYLFDPTHIKNMDIHEGSTRIDYFFANMNLEVLHREILFKKNTVSDHFGVYLEIRL